MKYVFSVAALLLCAVVYCSEYTKTIVEGRVVAIAPRTIVPYVADAKRYIFESTPAIGSGFSTYEEYKRAAPAVEQAAEEPEEDRVVELTKGAVRSLQQRCAKCHTEGKSPKAGFTLFDKHKSLYNELESSDWDEIVRRILLPVGDPERMPPTERFTPKELEELNFTTEQTGEDEDSVFVIDDPHVGD